MVIIWITSFVKNTNLNASNTIKNLNIKVEIKNSMSRNSLNAVFSLIAYVEGMDVQISTPDFLFIRNC